MPLGPGRTDPGRSAWDDAEMTSPHNPLGHVNAQFDQDAARNIVRMAVFAADAEAMKPPPVSRIRNPDGSAQSETRHEYTVRIAETAIMYVLEMSLVVMPDDIDTRLDRFLPAQRMP